jgi:hypothetical protein
MIQGTSPCGSTLHGATRAPGQQLQYPQDIKWRNALIPGGQQQGAMGQGVSSSTSVSGLGAGAGTYGVSLCVHVEELPTLT